MNPNTLRCPLHDAPMIPASSGKENVTVCPVPLCDIFAVRSVKDGVIRFSNGIERRTRYRAHCVFDRLWQDGHMTRGRAYAWLQHRMKIRTMDCHIAQFTIEECERVIRICASKLCQLEIESHHMRRAPSGARIRRKKRRHERN